MPGDPLLRADLDSLLVESKCFYFSVGPTSVSKNAVPVAGVYNDLYHKLQGDDGNFLTSGPDMRIPLDSPEPDPKLANTTSGRLQYFIKDAQGNKIPNTVKEDTQSPYTRTVFTHLPGGMVTVNEPNERNALIIVKGGIKVAFTYTSQRQVGMRINELRELIDRFLKVYLKIGIADTQIALNLDGGGSIFVGWVKNGRLNVLAAGGMATPKVYPLPPQGFRFRDVTTMVKHVLN